MNQRVKKDSFKSDSGNCNLEAAKSFLGLTIEIQVNTISTVILLYSIISTFLRDIFHTKWVL